MALDLNKIYEPTLLIDLEKLKANVSKMKAKCEANGLKLLPHFKTHQSAAIGHIIKEQGIEGITVSSIKMARYFANNGFERIHLALPPIQSQREELERLSQKVNLSVNVSQYAHLKPIEGLKIKVLIDLDPDYGRTGIDINDLESFKRFHDSILENKGLELLGVYVHNGASYKARIEIDKLHTKVLEKLANVRNVLGNEMNVFFGDTPGCSVANNFVGITHITAGNFVFYDLMQESFAACWESDIAICMACPIIEKHEGKNEFIIHGGAVHFSKDRMLNKHGLTIYGKMVHLSNNSWSSSIRGCNLISLSQEHGIIKVNNDVFEQYKVGDVIGILPVHSCLTADSMRQFISFDGTSYKAIDR